MTRLDRASNAFSQQTRFELPLNSITVNNLKTAKQRYRPVVPKVGATAPQGALARFRGAVRRKGAIGGR